MTLMAYPLPPCPTALSPPQHPVWLETEFPLELLERRRSSESLHPDHMAGSADVSLPSESRGLLDCDARLHVGWQHAVLILLGLVVEDVPGRHRHHSRANALGEQCFVSTHGETDFAPRGDQDHFGVAA